VEAILVAETDGYTREETEYQIDKVVEIFRRNNASTVKRTANRQEAEALWTARKSAYGVMARINNNLFVEDLARLAASGELPGIKEEHIELAAHNIVVLGHMWTFRRWYLARHYSLENYIDQQTQFILKMCSK
jgi:hypothetical protein